MYGSRDIQCKGKSFFSFWAIFAFDPPNNPKNQNFEILALSFSPEYHQWKSYDVWFLRYGAQQTEFFLILDHFLPFTLLPPNNQENQNFEKMKETPGDIIILHKCTINDNHTVYGSWDMKCTRQNSFFTLGYPPNSLKKKIQKNEKKKNAWRYHHFTQVYQKSWSFAILFLRYGTWWM